MSTPIPEPKIVELPTEALYDALSSNGWVHNKAGFARLLGICLGNVYNYLPSHTGGRRTKPFVPTIETLRRWSSIIQERTDLLVKITLPNNAPQGFEITGKAKSGQPLTVPMIYVVRPGEVFEPNDDPQDEA